MSTISKVCRCAISGDVPKRSFVVALVVGTLLNLINQGEAIFGGSNVNAMKLVMTYLVPYAVATFGAVSYQLNLDRQGRGSDDRS